MGYAFKLAGGAVFWSSKIQRRAAQTSTEVEYLAVIPLQVRLSLPQPAAGGAWLPT